MITYAISGDQESDRQELAEMLAGGPNVHSIGTQRREKFLERLASHLNQHVLWRDRVAIKDVISKHEVDFLKANIRSKVVHLHISNVAAETLDKTELELALSADFAITRGEKFRG